MIRARAVAVERGRRRVLDGVELELAGGEVTALIGPNGAGKSTLLAALAADLPLAAGRVDWDGEDVARIDAVSLARRRAWMRQGAGAAFGLSCLELVLLGRRPHGTPTGRDLALARRALDELDSGGLAARRADRLSGGERQRVELARALAQVAGATRPLLLLDEPTASLDPAHASRALAAVRARARDGAAACVALHDLSLASIWADRVVLLVDGRVAAAGAPAEVLSAARLASTYGAPLRALFDGADPAPIVAPPRRADASAGDGAPRQCAARTAR